MFFAFTVYLAVKSGIVQNKELESKIEEYHKNFSDTKNQYVWKNYNPITKKDFKEAFEKEGLLDKWEFFEKHLKPEIRVELSQVPENEILIGQSKIGGRPDLTKEVEWPKQNNGKHLTFLAQINLTELNNDEIDLPKEGLIYFFYSEDQEFWGYSKENANDFRTIYIANPKKLQRREIPSTLNIVKGGMYKPCKLKFTNSYSLPNWEHEFVSEQFKDIDNDPYIDISSSSEYITKLFGHSINIQGTMEYECEMVDRGYDWNNIPEKEKEDIKENQYNWKLLFQLDSENEAQMMWGDVGKLYFWIKESDLKENRFDRTWLILQCH